MASNDDIEKLETTAVIEGRREAEELRSILSDTYVAVRSAEINRQIISFTFDHYIAEAKSKIKSTRTISSASSNIGARPSKLEALDKLETDFNNSISKLKERAEAKDSPSGTL